MPRVACNVSLLPLPYYLYLQISAGLFTQLESPGIYVWVRVKNRIKQVFRILIVMARKGITRITHGKSSNYKR